MKKILLLIVSGLLIACMAGSAMASPFTPELYYKTSTGEYIGIGSSIDLKPGNSVSVYLGGWSFSSISLGNDYTWVADVSYASTSNPSDVSIDLPTTAFNPPTSPEFSSTSPYIHPDPIIISLDSSVGEGATYTVSVGAQYGDASAIIDQGIASRDLTAIPEFPTIAAPIAGIIGLLFIFGRKKEGL
ncbi:PEF-CTERM sorting domain-containing protein [Methanosarcina siciliae]|uniref:PEF-CTERM sorting domain-containing protein n=1 Tax=Methanosarcina siciliae TaxID=38027 RepID=UPI000696E34A|nr:PEF-CTERM sorting domain-containing protein [Methanosarcina siciliae]